MNTTRHKYRQTLTISFIRKAQYNCAEIANTETVDACSFYVRLQWVTSGVRPHSL